MKFHCDFDVNLFLTEVNRTDLLGKVKKDYKPCDELMTTFIKKRQGLISGLKDFRKSQDTKKQWRKFRPDIMRGIKRFHKSTEGKRFHRNLGRFIAGRTFLPTLGSLSPKAEALTVYEKADAMKAIYSASTHLMIELEYYHPINEQIGLEEVIFNQLSELQIISNKILRNENLTDENRSLLLLVTETSALIKSFAEKSGKSPDEVEKIWNEIKDQLKSEGKSEDDKGFFQNLVGVLKKRLKLE